MTSRRHRGFTLIELLISMAIAVLLLLMAVPSYVRWIADTEVQAGAGKLAEGLRVAQATAIKLNTNVEFTFSASGWTVQEPGGSAIKVGYLGEGAKYATLTPTPAGSTTVTFNYMGQIEAQNAAAPLAPFTEVNVTSANTTRPLRVLVGDSITGIKVCNPAFLYSATHPEGCP